MLAGTSAQGQPQMISDAEVRRVTAIKEKHEARLLKLPGVAGAGVGASSSEPGKAAIHLFVSRELTNIERDKFPKSLDGVAVEIKVTGPIVPLQRGFKKLDLRATRDVPAPGSRIVRNDAEWNKLLAELGAAGDPPKPDFSRETVAAIFAGEKRTGGYDVMVDRVSREKGRARIHWRLTAPPRDAAVTQALTYPFVVIAIEGSFKRIEFVPPVSNR